MTERGQVNFPPGSGRSPASVHRIVRKSICLDRHRVATIRQHRDRSPATAAAVTVYLYAATRRRCDVVEPGQDWFRPRLFAIVKILIEPTAHGIAGVGQS